MASIKANGFMNPKFMPVTSAAAAIIDTASITANPTAADTIDFFVPAGIEVFGVEIQATDMDTNGAPTFAFSVGYAPVDPASSLAANATYFAAAGQTTFRTGGRLRCDFRPITFNEDVMLRLTVGTAAATFAAGTVDAIVIGNMHGPR